MLKKKGHHLNPNRTDTLIGEGTNIEGKISSKASLRIEGRVDGDIECSGDITVGENGVVNSHVSARNVTNAGSIRGSITTKGLLTITATGKVYGDINVSSVQIVEGGMFQGTSRMESKANRFPDKEHEANDVPLKVDKITAVK